VKLQTPYKNLLPPLSEAESTDLERSIATEGVRDALVVWKDKGILIDGHNRYDIANRLGGPFQTKESELEDDEDAQTWILANQLARRNVTPFVRVEIALKHEALFQSKAKERQGTRTDLGRNIPQKSAESSHKETRSEIAAMAGTSHDTVAKVKKILASKDDDLIEKARKGVETVNSVHRSITHKAKAAEIESKRKEAAKKVVGTDNVRLGDFRKVLEDVPDASCELIFTDPPYDVLIDGGSLITYLGHYAMPEVMNHLSRRLKFFWPICIWNTGSNAQMDIWGIRVKWKPLLWYVKGDCRLDVQSFVDDGIASVQEKDWHDWQQSLVEARYYIERLTKRGALVIDPFCGGGTTAFAAQELSRKFITCDTDPVAIGQALKRIAS